jgi:hypothetical protein
LDIEAEGAMVGKISDIRVIRLHRQALDEAGVPHRVPVCTRIDLPARRNTWAQVTVGSQLEAEAYDAAYAVRTPERLNSMVYSQLGPPLDRGRLESTLVAAGCDFMITAEDALMRLGAPLIARTHTIVTDPNNQANTKTVKEALSVLKPQPFYIHDSELGVATHFQSGVGVIRWQERDDYFAIRGIKTPGHHGNVLVASAHDALDSASQLGWESRDSTFSICAAKAVELDGKRAIEGWGGHGMDFTTGR